jgi:hypothetical protein
VSRSALVRGARDLLTRAKAHAPEDQAELRADAKATLKALTTGKVDLRGTDHLRVQLQDLVDALQQRRQAAVARTRAHRAAQGTPTSTTVRPLAVSGPTAAVLAHLWDRRGRPALRNADPKSR